MPYPFDNGIRFASTSPDGQGPLMNTGADWSGVGRLTFGITTDPSALTATGQLLVSQWAGSVTDDCFIFATARQDEWSAGDPAADGVRLWILCDNVSGSLRTADLAVADLLTTRHTFVVDYDGSQAGDAKVRMWHARQGDSALTEVTSSLIIQGAFGGTDPFPVTLNTSSVGVDIGGSNNWGGGNTMDGDVVDVWGAVGTDALSVAEIEGSAVWNSAAGEPGDKTSLGLTNWWPVDGDSGTSVTDVGSAGNDGTLTTGGAGSTPTIVAYVTSTTQQIAVAETATTGQTVAARQRQRVAVSETATTGQSITGQLGGATQAIAATETATTAQTIAVRQRQQVAVAETATTDQTIVPGSSPWVIDLANDTLGLEYLGVSYIEGVVGDPGAPLTPSVQVGTNRQLDAAGNDTPLLPSAGLERVDVPAANRLRTLAGVGSFLTQNYADGTQAFTAFESPSGSLWTQSRSAWATYVAANPSGAGRLSAIISIVLITQYTEEAAGRSGADIVSNNEQLRQDLIAAIQALTGQTLTPATWHPIPHFSSDGSGAVQVLDWALAIEDWVDSTDGVFAENPNYPYPTGSDAIHRTPAGQLWAAEVLGVREYQLRSLGHDLRSMRMLSARADGNFVRVRVWCPALANGAASGGPVVADTSGLVPTTGLTTTYGFRYDANGSGISRSIVGVTIDGQIGSTNEVQISIELNGSAPGSSAVAKVDGRVPSGVAYIGYADQGSDPATGSLALGLIRDTTTIPGAFSATLLAQTINGQTPVEAHWLMPGQVQIQVVQAINVAETSTTGQAIAARQRQQAAAAEMATTGQAIAARQRQQIAATETATTGQSITGQLGGVTRQISADETATTGQAIAARQRQLVAAAEAATTGQAITATSTSGQAINVAETATTGQAISVRQRQRVAASAASTSGQAISVRQRQRVAVAETATTADTVVARQRQRVAAAETATTGQAINATSAGASIGLAATATSGETISVRQRQRVAVAETATSSQVLTAQSATPQGPGWAGVGPLMHRYKIWDHIRWRMNRITYANGYDVEVATVERYARSYTQFGVGQTPAICVFPAAGQPPPEYRLSEAREDLLKLAIVLHVRGTDPDWRSLELGLLEEAVFAEINRDPGLGGWAIETVRVEGGESDEGTPERQSSADGSSTLVTAVRVRYCAGQVSSRVLKHASSYLVTPAPTVIVTPGIYVPVAGTFAAGVVARSFTVGADGSLTYTDERGYTFRLTATLSVDCPTAGTLSARIRVDGTGQARTLVTRSNEAGERVQVALDDLLDLSANDVVQVELTHSVAQSITVQNAVETITVAPFG